MKTFLSILFLLTIFGCSSSGDSLINNPRYREPASFQSCFQTMNNLLNYKTYSGDASDSFSSARSLVELESLYGSDSLIEIQKKLSNTEILKNNNNLAQLLKMPHAPKEMAEKSTIVLKSDIESIYRTLEGSHVHKNHDCYDPKGTIGFCFGRATIAHMEAIVKNIHPDSIKKIWIAGDMGIWGHHVATMIYSKEGWMVLDTNLGRVVSVNDWVATYMPYKKGEKEIMVFVTQAGRFGPYDNRPYNAIDLFNSNSEDFDRARDYFNGYFHDYFESLDNLQNKPLHKKRFIFF